MTGKAFVIQQIGARGSTKRRRADQIYNYIIVPAVQDAGLDPYRADLDPSPGAITPQMLSGLLNARLVIADLTGRNPNVFYELGVAHSFARPLILIADASDSLPFDTRGERVIEIGEYPSNGLSYEQVVESGESLKTCLRVVLSDGYLPPSPLREVAISRSVDDLIPDDPMAAELAQMRDTLDDIRKHVTTRTSASPPVQRTLDILREVVERNLTAISDDDIEFLQGKELTTYQNRWARRLARERLSVRSQYDEEPMDPSPDGDQ